MHGRFEDRTILIAIFGDIDAKWQKKLNCILTGTIYKQGILIS